MNSKREIIKARKWQFSIQMKLKLSRLANVPSFDLCKCKCILESSFKVTHNHLQRSSFNLSLLLTLKVRPSTYLPTYLRTNSLHSVWHWTNKAQHFSVSCYWYVNSNDSVDLDEWWRQNYNSDLSCQKYPVFKMYPENCLDRFPSNIFGWR